MASADAAESRKRFLGLLKSLQGQGPVTLYLLDNPEPRKASSVAAALPDTSAYIVRDLETPLGTIPTAIIRGSDVVKVVVDITENS